MSLKPHLKVEINYYRKMKVKEYDFEKAGISRSAFLNALNGGSCEIVTIHKAFDLLNVPESERKSLIEWGENDRG
ncbi:MAG: hypothetical protein JW984_16180 [Deltaproteobacteria bacterium]|uniref:Uncharacterized protein n=1 Tax=Candidatus Zymogenus saltonus TaxID=2844893 RepID=A0A9D8KGQ9_9DELT|nr:hypothetical protein [Candidatus Zymogenus saltonus]